MIKNNLFYKEELAQFSLVYYKMDELKVSELKELNTTSVFGKSKKHSSEYYLVVYPVKPFSNFVIDGKEL